MMLAPVSPKHAEESWEVVIIEQAVHSMSADGGHQGGTVRAERCSSASSGFGAGSTADGLALLACVSSSDLAVVAAGLWFSSRRLSIRCEEMV